MRVRDLIKPLAKKTVFREGAIRPILRGPARGLRYRIYADYGLAPLYGGWESDLQHLMTKLVRPGDVVYDVGANFGMHTLLLSRLVGEHGHVYAFEPVPEIAAELDRNLSLNNISNVSIVPQALSDRRGTAAFDRGHHAGAGHLSAVADGDLTVELTTLDEFALLPGNRRPNLVKIDAEGAESKVLQGGRDLLADAASPHVLVETHSLGEERVVGALLLENGYVLRELVGEGVVRSGGAWPHATAPWGYIVASLA